MRVIIFSGKGGSGVSTLAAATAVASAKGGRRTLALGLGPGLAAVFGVSLGQEPAVVASSLWALEGRSRHDSPDEVRDWLGALLEWRGMEAGLAEDLAALPGVNSLGRLLDLERQVREGWFDAVVVDAATLTQFLEVPGALDSAARWLERLFAPREQTFFEPFLRVFAGEYASTGDDVLERGRDILTRLANLRTALCDPEISSVRLVSTPDMGAAGDVQRAIAALNLFGYPVDAVAVNRKLPVAVSDAFFAAVRAQEEETARYLASAVAPMPVLVAELTRSRPRDVESLAALAGGLYAGWTPSAVLHRGQARAFSQEDGRHVLRVALPFVQREDLGLEQTEEGVAVHLDGRRCVLPLPSEMRGREAESWSIEGQVLKITFGA